jgi:NADH dehydrogenase
VGIELICDAQAQKITPTQVQTTKGTFASDITILCTGVKPNTEFFSCAFTLDPQGHIPVNRFLQTQQNEYIFALGDVAIMEERFIPKLAQTAVQQAKIVGRNIASHAQGLPMNVYRPYVRGVLFSLGFGDGIGKIGPVVVKGFLAWYLWRTVYLFKTPGLGNKLRVAFSWTLGLFQGRNIIEL